MVVEGKDKLCFNRIREGTDSVNMCTTCCDSLLIVDHPNYHPDPSQAGVTMMFPEFCPIIDGDTETPFEFEGSSAKTPFEPFMAVQTGDWPDQAALDKYDMPRVWVDHTGATPAPGYTGTAGWDTGFGKFMENACKPVEGPGETFAELLAGAGGKISILGIKEGAASAGVKAKAAGLPVGLPRTPPPPPKPHPPYIFH